MQHKKLNTIEVYCCPSLQFEWNITKNENMADISGLQLAYQAWETDTEGKEATLPGINLNAQQLFFLNAAQVY